MFPGLGTLVNVATVLLGSAIGVLLGHRLPGRTRDIVTDALGLVTLLIAALSVVAVQDSALVAAVGGDAPVLVVLASLVIGGIVGSLLRVENRLEDLGQALQRRLTRGAASEQRRRFVEGFVTAGLVFCVGPLTILGSISDGLGRGAEQLVLKAVLDGFASIAFAAAYGWGVGAAALIVLAIQGTLTLLGAVLGEFLSEAQILALTATGGLLLIGVALRLLRIKPLPVGDLLPALVVAPVVTAVVAAF
ncbi:MAG TPA: DUF554 domain-containing protein [Actinopolymorphaceae bacterium]